ncbi:MAG: hypothetical protein KDC53_08800 [Saprospiraceae bacterium]|nr:hypothetical protein [Saprospiraceae bacterium]
MIYRILFSVFLAGQAITGVQAQSIFEKWPALNAYHEVMKETFHASEDGNLAPLKSRSGDLKSQADILAKSEIPAEFNSPMIKTAIMQLKKDSKSIAKQVKKGKSSDGELTRSMAALHEVFHKIVGLCKEGH